MAKDTSGAYKSRMTWSTGKGVSLKQEDQSQFLGMYTQPRLVSGDVSLDRRVLQPEETASVK